MRPILFSWGPITLHSWGTVVAIAVAVGLYLLYKDAKRVGIEQSKMLDFGLLGIILALIGARFIYVLFDLETYLNNPIQIFYFQQGGLSIHGALLGGLIAAIIFAKLNKIPIFKLLDLAAPFIILGQAIGRIGCFLAGICYGKVTTLPWAIQFVTVPGARHPTQLYESALNFIIFAFLWSYRKKIRFEGQLFLIYLMAYSTARGLVEVLRDDMQLIGPITFAQLTSIIVVIVAGAIYFIKAKKAAYKTKNPVKSSKKAKKQLA